MTGSFNSAGEWQITEADVLKTNSLGLGASGRLDFYSPGAAPTARIVLKVLAPGSGLIEFHQDLEVREDVFGSSQTHSVQLDSLDSLILGLYPSVYDWSLFLELNVDSVPGNTVGGSAQLAYAVGGKGVATGAITETKISDDSISTPKLQSKVITTDKIATGAITAESGIIGSINAGTITVGEMNGARIKANTIAADRVLIGNGAEMMPDEYGLSDQPWYTNFDGGAGTGWSAEAAYPGQSRGVVLTHKPTGTSNMSLYANTLHPDYQIPVQPGETYQVFTWVYATGPVSGLSSNSGVSMQVYGYSNGAYKTNTRAGTALAQFPSGEWVKVGGAWTAPAGIDKFSPRLTVYYPAGATTNSAKFYIGRVSVKSQIGATLIEGGAISTEHIRAGAITAESGIIGSIDANVITVGKIMGNQLDADAINGKTITGAKIRTASSGSRVELTHNGLKQYNSLGATIVDMTAGSFTLQGGSITGSTIKTASSGSRVEITSSGLKQYDSKNAVIADMTGGSLEMKGVLEQQNTIARMRMGAMWADNSPGIIWSEGEFAGQSNPPAISTVAFSNMGPNEESGHSLYIQGPNANSQAHLGNKWWRMRAYGDVAAKYGWVYQGVDFTNIQNNYTSTNMSWMTQSKDSSTIGNRVSSTRQASLHLNANSGERTSLVRNTSASGGQWLNLTDTFNVLTWSHPTNSGSAYLRLEDRYAFLGSYDGAGDVVGFLRMNSTESVLSSYKRSMGIWGNQRMMLESKSDSTSAYMKSDMIYYRTYSGSANVYITGNKVLGRSTSSRRYKDNIETIPRERYENALLSLDFRTWQAKAEIAEHEEFLAWREENPMCPTPERFMEVSDDGPGWEAGMIAEELYDAGLDFLVPLDHYGRPESVNYDRIGPALIPIVREQRDRIEALESRLEALEVA